MKKFKFSLEKLLEIREQELKSERDELAKLNAQKRDMELEVERLLIRFDETNRELVNSARLGIAQQEMVLKKAFINKLSDDMRVLRYKISHMDTKIDAQMVVVMEASRSVKVIEKLKEKRVEEYHKEELKAEEQFIEEFVSATRQNDSYL